MSNTGNRKKYFLDRGSTLSERIRAYHLHGNVYVLIGLSILGSLTLLFYAIMPDRNGLAANLFLAIATSLMASVFVLAVETVLKYYSHRSDLFLEGIRRLGISNLHFQKKELLEYLLRNDCSERFCAVGYRCILTASLATDIAQRAAGGVQIRLLMTPPWSEAFRQVYGPREQVARNYWTVLESLRKYCGENATNVEVRFTEKPIFSDTYIVDGTVVTGPYMHLKDERYGKLAAFDFFTYELDEDSKLQQRSIEEFENLWEEPNRVMNWRMYCEKAAQAVAENADFRDSELQELLKSCSPEAKEDIAGEN